ncbi:TrbI/VirB10 family protein [Sphingobium sp. AN641]|uniref:TrbI/VirB10 family protein n=1 Tax=Sphingobium sp. AN641 TaxID=3133443 RepID=UPI0030C53851
MVDHPCAASARLAGCVAGIQLFFDALRQPDRNADIDRVAGAERSGEWRTDHAFAQSTQQNVSRAGDQITSRNLQIQPTITVRPGAAVRLVVHKDIILAPWREKER